MCKIIDFFSFLCLVYKFISNILSLILHRCFRVDPNAKEHTDCVLEANAKKLVRDEMYNIRLQATNAYLKSQVVQINSF
jgi:hypothetical protein